MISPSIPIAGNRICWPKAAVTRSACSSRCPAGQTGTAPAQLTAGPSRSSIAFRGDRRGACSYRRWVLAGQRLADSGSVVGKPPTPGQVVHCSKWQHAPCPRSLLVLVVVHCPSPDGPPTDRSSTAAGSSTSTNGSRICSAMSRPRRRPERAMTGIRASTAESVAGECRNDRGSIEKSSAGSFALVDSTLRPIS